MNARALAIALLAVAGLTSPVLAAPLEGSATVTYLNSAAGYAGFDSPYLGHDGFRNLPLDFSDQDLALLDAEAAIGLRWTWAGVAWTGVEPAGPTDAAHDPLGAWAKIDRWVEACHDRGLNLILQPVMSGNGGAPPAWAGYRTPAGIRKAQTWTDPDGVHHRSGASTLPGPIRAPRNMGAAADFAAKLVRRYKPGGDLAQELGWTDGYGVRAWEIDNEPDAYGLWTSELDDYAELITKMRAAMKAEDPEAIVLGPAVAAGATQPTDAGMPALMMLLDKRVERASVEYARNGRSYAVGPQVDAISFHTYEDLDGTTAEQTLATEKPWWDLYSSQAGFPFDPTLEFWLTEGGRWTLDDDWAPRWFPQYFARGFAGGISRMIVQGVAENGLTKTEASVATFIRLFPAPDGITKLSAPADPAQIYRDGDTRWTYVAWATNGTVTVSIPVRTPTAIVTDVAGNASVVPAVDGAVSVTLRQATMFNEPIYVSEAP